MSLTPTQQAAVSARGNVLLMAGAGTGKTSTLVARCLHCLLEEDPPATLDQLLLVTFTDAAAGDMRRRIRAEFEKQLQKLRSPDPATASDAGGHSGYGWQNKQREIRLQEQLATFDTAHIGTLHSFCLNLVRQHFYELELDPQLSVLPAEEGRLLAEETLESILEAHYAGDSAVAAAVQQLIQTQARGWDKPVRALILKLHHYTQTLRHPAGWFEEQLAHLANPEPVAWRQWLSLGVVDWRDRWRAVLRAQSPENAKARELAGLLEQLPAEPEPADCRATLAGVQAADGEWPRGKKTLWRKPIEGLFKEAAFLSSLVTAGTTHDPLAQDWNWMRGQMSALLGLAREFAGAFSEAKRELGMVDFHDLEQHALRVLWDPVTNEPTASARQWRQQLRFVFVDEYQDINEAQDAILQALSRTGAEANRFLVGDVKQSIYRFRLADPRIFQDYVRDWSAGVGRVIPLVENFRSREAILAFVNSLFTTVMRAEIGRVEYDTMAELRFGDPAGRQPLAQAASEGEPRVELRLRFATAADAVPDETEAGDAPANLEEAEKEARLVARRLLELKTAGHLIWSEKDKALRPVDWRDMAVLLRSPARKAEGFAREFARQGVPLAVARGGFYESLEITDLLSLLQLLDNPRQDVPLFAILRSPLVGLTLDELAAVRLASPRGPGWLALQSFHHNRSEQPGWPKIDRFLQRYAAWRRLARQVSLSHCLETVLTETHYADWLLAQSRGEERHANVRRLLALARQFDRFQRQGLFRFLRFIAAQQETETEPDTDVIAAENSVSLMSIHQSKGLEFPVVVVADLGKEFNLSDLRAEIILDESFGLCPQIKPPGSGTRYPSLPYWLAQRRQREENLGEELRLLYVAMTRARDTLILTGTLTPAMFERQWTEPRPVNAPALLAAKSYLDWLALWTVQATATRVQIPAGANDLWRWNIYVDDAHLSLEPLAAEATNRGEDEAVPAAVWKELQKRLAWQYPHREATQIPAKSSATALSRQLGQPTDEEAPQAGHFQPRRARFKTSAGNGLSASEIGTAHHLFLQRVSLSQVGNRNDLAAEAQRLIEQSVLTPAQAAALNLPAIAAFWQSAAGRRIRSQPDAVRRELAFTARFLPAEITGAVPPPPELFEEEFVVVQGVADLVVILPEEIWLVDFKTDALDPDELPAKVSYYGPQLRLYAAALTRIYHLPVTSAQLYFLATGQGVEVRTNLMA